MIRIPSGNGRDYGKFVIVLDPGLHILLEPYILVVQVKVYKFSERAVALAYPLLYAWIFPLQGVKDLSDGRAVHGNLGASVRKLSKGGGNPYLYCHLYTSFFVRGTFLSGARHLRALFNLEPEVVLFPFYLNDCVPFFLYAFWNVLDRLAAVKHHLPKHPPPPPFYLWGFFYKIEGGHKPPQG